MRKETVLFGVIALGAIAFFLGRLSVTSDAPRPAAPTPSRVAAAVRATVPAPGASAAPSRAALPAPPKVAAPTLAATAPSSDAAGAPSRGAWPAKVTIVVFSDFQCPFCRQVEPTLQRILREFPDDVRVVWKNNPLGMHDRARAAALASLAAHRQGRFWEMHDLLFANNRSLTDEDIAGFARALGLDLQAFDRDLRDPALAEQLRKEQGTALALGARGTPSFFLNGIALRGARPYEDFLRTIREGIEQADAALAAGTAPEALHETLARRNNPAGEVFVATVVRGEEPPEPAEAAEPEDDGTVWRVTVGQDDPVRGGETALVTVVLFSDFECPFCSRVGQPLARLLQTYGDDVRLVWKNSPLSFHKRAQLAAEAALAAHAEGKFWEMHDKLFANQAALERADLERYAGELGLDLARFRQALDSGAYRAKVEADLAAAREVNSNGTPTMFVNGRRLVGVKSYEELEGVVRAELEAAQKMVAAGVGRGNVYNQILARGKRFQELADQAHTFDDGRAPSKGARNARVVITEFSDFQCPFCSRVGGPLEAVQKLYPEQVRIVFKHFPLSFHKQAQLAAEASMAAHAQGKFWEMHDRMFANQKALGRADLERYAAEIGLDLERFRRDLDTGEHRARVSADMREAASAGVNGTPTLFVNGRKWEPPGGVSVTGLKQLVQRELGGQK